MSPRRRAFCAAVGAATRRRRDVGRRWASAAPTGAAPTDASAAPRKVEALAAPRAAAPRTAAPRTAAPRKVEALAAPRTAAPRTAAPLTAAPRKVEALDAPRTAAPRTAAPRTAAPRVVPKAAPAATQERSLANPFTGAPEHILVTSDFALAGDWAAAHATGVVGLDVEITPSLFKSSTGLPVVLQLAGSGSTLVLQLGARTGALPPQLRVAIEDALICKAGVGVRIDLLDLRKAGFLDGDDAPRPEALPSKRVAGAVDVGLAGRRFFEKQTDGMPVSLKRLVDTCFGLRDGESLMTKSKKVQMSNWGLQTLTEKQVDYAAMDAMAGRDVFLALKDRGAFEDAELEALHEALEECCRGAASKADFKRALRLAREFDSALSHLEQVEKQCFFRFFRPTDKPPLRLYAYAAAKGWAVRHDAETTVPAKRDSREVATGFVFIENVEVSRAQGHSQTAAKEAAVVKAVAKLEAADFVQEIFLPTQSG
ncbi:ribonuclease H-like domain-containing protein [Pelagophyceae sp. CCMP2097]|nr:ribonuclease H-like domain-containing protein [Pelagophyceae sp. CCMP2097]